MTINFPRQLAEGAKAAKNVKVSGDFSRVIFCGLGGSAIPGEIISTLWLDGFNCYIQRGFGLPHWAGREHLIICTSWSGNTEETISSFKAAQELGIPTAAITKGGELAKTAREHDALLIKLPDDPVPPRLGVGYMLASLLTLLNNSAIIDFKLPTNIQTKPVVGPRFSSRIGFKTPLIYSSYQWRYLAKFWKTNFNEDCKIHSFSNYFPEAAHNELAGFAVPAPSVPAPTLTVPLPKLNLALPASPFCPSVPSCQRQAQFRHEGEQGRQFIGNAVGTLKPFPIILADPDEDKADKDILEKFASFLAAMGIDHEVIKLTGGGRLEKILGNYNLAVSTSFDLARHLGVDPLDASAIETFKKSRS